MAETTPSQEAITRSVLTKEQEKPVRGHALTTEQRRINTLKDELAKGEQRKSLEGMVKRVPKKEEMRSQADDSIGTEIDAAGKKKRNTDERERYKNATDALDNVYDYLDTGVMDAGELANVQHQIHDIARNYPGAEDLISELGIDKITDELLKDPHFRNKLQDRLNEIKANRVKDLDPEVVNAAKEAKKLEELKKKELARVKGEADSVRTEIERYGIAPPGDLRKEHDDIVRNLSTLDADAKKANVEIRGVDRSIKDLERQKELVFSGKLKLGGTFEEDLEKLDGKISAKEIEREEKQEIIDKRDEAIARRKQIVDDEKVLRERRKELEPQEDQLSAETADLTGKRIQAENALTLAKRERSAVERAYVESLEDVFADTTIRHLDERIKEAEAQQAELLQKEISEEQDDERRDILKQLAGGRWDSEGEVYGLLGKKRMSIDIDMSLVDQDYRDLLLNGPEDAVKKILKDQGVTEDKIREMMNDQEFAQKAQNMLAEQIFMRKFKNKKPTRDEVFKIASTDWGQDAINRGVNRNDAAKSMVDNLKNKGLLGDSTPAEFIRKHPRSTVAGILIALLGGAAMIPFGVAAAGAVWSAEAVAGGGAATWKKFKDKPF